MGLDDREYRQNDSWKKNPQNEKKEFNTNKEKMTNEEKKRYYEQIEQIRNKNNPINKNRKNVTKNQENENEPFINWYTVFPIVIIIIGWIMINAYSKKTNNIQPTQPTTQSQIQPQQPINTKTMTRPMTTDEEKTYMEKNHLIKLGNEYTYYGIKESKDILPITKALDMDCQNDFCKIQKYYDYVKKIPYERGTEGKDKNAIEVLEDWKGDCDERSDLLASMMLANGYKTILLYTNNHALTALNIPNFEPHDNRSYIQYEGRKYYIAETTDPNGQIGGYNENTMHNIKYIYDVNEKRIASNQEVNIQLYKR